MYRCQYKVAAAHHTKHPATCTATQLAKLHTHMGDKLQDFRQLQALYMPGAVLAYMLSTGFARPELADLQMPSSLPFSTGTSVCPSQLAQLEICL
jgi:hypothetical protein